MERAAKEGVAVADINKVSVNLPWALFKLAEQIPPDGDDTMILTVTGSQGNHGNLRQEN